MVVMKIAAGNEKAKELFAAVRSEATLGSNTSLLFETP